jgi:hypothetical protein
MPQENFQLFCGAEKRDQYFFYSIGADDVKSFLEHLLLKMEYKCLSFFQQIGINMHRFP